MNTTMADGAEQRLDAQIAEALFGQPGMSKMDVANLVRELRGDGPALLVPREAGQDERARFEAWAKSRNHTWTRWGDAPGDVKPLFVSEVAGHYICRETQAAWEAWQHLSAQPSPGGQGDAHDIEDPCDVITRAAQKLSAAGQPRIADRLVRTRTEVERLQAAYPAARQPVGEPVCSGGFVISNGSGEKYMAWGQVGPEWTADRSAALWLVRRADAEALAAENEDAWSILPVERCALPPNGWACTLAAGHEGPCPTIAAPPAQAVDLGAVCQLAEKWMRIGGEDARFCAGELLTLIDGKAVGK